MPAIPNRVVLQHRRAPGDITVLTALARDLRRAYPAMEIDVHTTFPDLWENNPHLTRFIGTPRAAGARHINCVYGRGLSEQARETIHFLAYFHRDFERQLHLPVKLTEPYPDLHLSARERETPLLPKLPRYWVMVAGGKTDMPTKVWHAGRFQQVADRMREAGIPVVVVGGGQRQHWGPKLTGVVDLVGRTTRRELLQLIHHSDGVICGITFPMHAAAALHRPCVALGGGREAWYWEAYVRENVGLGGAEVASRLRMPHRYLHTIGLLDCCLHKGCWKPKLVALQPRDANKVCAHPVYGGPLPVPKCLDMITVDHVLEAVMSYYVDNSLPPIPTSVGAIDVQTLAAAAHGQPVYRHTFSRTPETILSGVSPGPEPAAAAATPDLPSPEPDWLQAARRRAAEVVADPAVTAGLAPATTTVAAQPKLVPEPPRQLPAWVQGPAIRGVATTSGHPSPLSQLMTHPAVGGKWTIAAVFYGPDKYFDAQNRMLEGVRKTVPASVREFRFGTNALGGRMLRRLRQLRDAGEIVKLYEHEQNIYKYPVMREIFHDPALPLQTRWVLWFDDDMFCDTEPHWGAMLAQLMIQYGDSAQCFGDIRVSTVRDPRARQWYESRPWHRGRPWRDARGNEAPNGVHGRFVTGGMFAITAEAIRIADVPDAQLGNNLGDVTIGEQLWQNRLEMRMFNKQFSVIQTRKDNRRGVQTSHPAAGEIRIEREFDSLRAGGAVPPLQPRR